MSILTDFLKALSISWQKRDLFTEICNAKRTLDKNKVVKVLSILQLRSFFKPSVNNISNNNKKKPVYRRLNKNALFPLEIWQATQSCGILLRIFTDPFSNFPGRNDLRINIKVKFTFVTRDIKDKVFKKFVRID